MTLSRTEASLNECLPSVARIAVIEHQQLGNCYPWLNLVDVGDANAIWAKYRCPNGGGKVVLVDPEGVIVAVDPSAEDVRAYLTEFYSTHE